MTVSTIVVDTALTTLHVTNKLVIVTGDVNRDIQTRTAARVYTYCIQKYNTYVFKTFSKMGK